jgi:hypothetical protein
VIQLFVFIAGKSIELCSFGAMGWVSKCKEKATDCWIPEIVLLNTGKASQLGAIPILFRPASSDKLVKNVDTNVLFAFLKPFIEELEDTFINGFPISYAYPGSYISEELIRDKLMDP